MRIVGVIPSRYKSSRFPGKPLADICGKPMVWWVCQQALKSEGLDDLYVATDDGRIADVCEEYRIKTVMTSESCPTGVDRLAEVALDVYADFYVLIQGDEPLLEGETISRMVKIVRRDPSDESVKTFKTPIKNPVDIVNYTVIKVVTDLNDNVLFASRSAIPYPKGGIGFQYYKSVGIYAYPRSVLLQYPGLPRGPLESAEDHDFMRMLENGINMKAYAHDTETISVDTPKDLERVRKIMEENLNEGVRGYSG